MVVLSDADALTDPGRAVFGRAPRDRLIDVARAAGFSGFVLAPGTLPHTSEAPFPPTGREDELAEIEAIGHIALVVYEGVYLRREILELMVEHPLDADEQYSLYDSCGRPAAWFTGCLAAVPWQLPVGEELPWPEPHGPDDIARIVYPEDERRCEALILRDAEGVRGRASWWQETVDAHALRWMTRLRRPPAQLEWIALLLALSSLPLAWVGTPLTTWLAASGFLVGGYWGSLLSRIRALRNHAAKEAPDEHRLEGAIRPMGQAAFMIGLTYAIVAQTERSNVSSVVLLAAGTGSALLSLVRARAVLRGRATDRLSLPNAEEVARRLAIPWLAGVHGAPLVELLAWCSALFGHPEVPWSVLVAATVARLWGWFSGPEDLFPRWMSTSYGDGKVSTSHGDWRGSMPESPSRGATQPGS